MVRRISVALATLVAIVAAWMLINSIAPESHDVATLLPTDTAQRINAISSVQTEASSKPEASAVERQAGSPQGAVLSSCSEASKSGIHTVNSGDENACARALQLFGGPTVPALPDLAGFEILDVGENSPRARLFSERNNATWSGAMEGQILTAISDVVDFPVNTLHSVCRSRTCGVVFAYSDYASQSGSYNFYAQELADRLGFSGYYAGASTDRNGIGFTFVYLGDWITPRPE